MHVLPFVLRYGESRNESYVEINRKQRRHFALRSTSATAFALAWLAPKMSFQRYKLYYLLLHVGPAQTSDVLPIISDIRAHCTFVRTADHCSTAVTLRAHTSDAAATFVLLLSVHLFWLHSLIRVRFVIKTGILERSLTEIICAHFCSTPPHRPTPHTNSKCTYSVSETDRQTSLPNTAAWWSKPIDHPISSPINHLLSFALSPTNPPSCTISPFFVPSLPTSFSLYAFAFNPSLKSRSTKRPNLYHSRHQPKTVKYTTGCFKQVVPSAAQCFVLTAGPYKRLVMIRALQRSSNDSL